MKEAHKNKIEEIMGEIQCPKNFNCIKSGLEVLCKAKDLGLENYLKCLESNPNDCKFALPFGYNHFCQCPLRVYLAKNLKK